VLRSREKYELSASLDEI